MKVNKNSPIYLKKQIRNAAKMYEEQFLRQMVKAMRGTVTHSKMTQPSMAEKIYSEQLDQEYVQQWSSHQGTGLADLIYQDIIDKYYPQLAESGKVTDNSPKSMNSQSKSSKLQNTDSSPEVESSDGNKIQLSPTSEAKVKKREEKGSPLDQVRLAPSRSLLRALLKQVGKGRTKDFDPKV